MFSAAVHYRNVYCRHYTSLDFFFNSSFALKVKMDGTIVKAISLHCKPTEKYASQPLNLICSPPVADPYEDLKLRLVRLYSFNDY